MLEETSKEKEDKMKTLKLKMLVTAGIAATCFALTSAVPPGNEAPSSSPNGRFEKENMDIRHDISSISMQEDKISSLKERYKADKNAGKKMEVLADKKELAKARADLKRDKNYLSADKKDLKCDHKLALSEKKKEIRNDKKMLSENRKSLDKELAKGNEARSQEYAAKVVEWQNELKNDESALSHDKKDMKDNLTAVNKAIKKSDEKSGVAITVASKNTSSSTSSNSR